MDPEASQAMGTSDEARAIFGNPVILNCILEQLPNSKLLELSFVNKLWKKEARIVIKKRGDVMAFLKCDDATECGQVFQAFAANLETLNEAMYSVMFIWLNPRRIVECKATGALDVEVIYESILTGMRGNLKRLFIRLDDPEVCWNAQNCPNFLLLRLLMRDFIGDLEHLRLRIDKIMEPFIQQLSDGPYPKLKVLELIDQTLKEETFENQIRLLLSRAPNLQEIHTYGQVSLRENLLEGREGVVHVHEAQVRNAMKNISENSIPALRLKWIGLIYNTELNLDRFNEKAQYLLRTCCATTLEYLVMDIVSAVLLMSYGIQLVNVTALSFNFDYPEFEQLEPRIMSILSRFDFTYLFPNCKKVIIIRTGLTNPGVLSRDPLNTIIEQANAVWTEPTLPRAGNIKCLELLYLDNDAIPASALQLIAQMFPDLEELHGWSMDQAFPVGSAWELWPDLKLMTVDRSPRQRP